MWVPGSYCHACGHLYSTQTRAAAPQQPRHCEHCGTTVWSNPTPVAVMLQPVYLFTDEWETGRTRPYQKNNVGVLLVRRGIAPYAGQWCLPGGFADYADASYEAAAARELTEEVSLLQPWYFPQGSPRLLFSTQGDPGQIISFSANTAAVPEHWLETFRPCKEVTEVRVTFSAQPLCFSSHTVALRQYLQHYLPSCGVVEQLVDRQASEQLFRNDREQKYAGCQHVWRPAPDLFDPHKNETYQSCMLCGKVV